MSDSELRDPSAACSVPAEPRAPRASAAYLGGTCLSFFTAFLRRFLKEQRVWRPSAGLFGFRKRPRVKP